MNKRTCNDPGAYLFTTNYKLIVIWLVSALEKSRHQNGSRRTGIALQASLGLHDQDKVREQQRHTIQVNSVTQLGILKPYHLVKV